MICTLLYREGLFFHPLTGALVAVPSDGAQVTKLWDSLDEHDEYFVLDGEGDWLSHARIRLLQDGRGLYHDDVDGYELVSESEVEEWLEEGLLVKALPEHPQEQ